MFNSHFFKIFLLVVGFMLFVFSGFTAKNFLTEPAPPLSSFSALASIPGLTPTPPGIPTIVSVTAVDHGATINFTAPGSNGSSTITNYKYSTDNGVTWITPSPAITTSPIAVTGLTNCTTYAVLLKAVNAIGDGTATAATPVTPVVIAPAGIDWKTQTSADETSTWSGVTYGNNLFVAVGGQSVMTSPDGITWTLGDCPILHWSSVAYGNGVFVAVATEETNNAAMTSPDGLTWTEHSTTGTNSLTSVTFGNNLFVAVASTGTNDQVMTSPDGITWTVRTTPAATSWNSVTYGNGLFVAVASDAGSPHVMTSPDGITWTSRDSAEDIAYCSVCYGNGLFVAVANDPAFTQMMTSTDAITWTSMYTGGEAGLSRVTYGNGLFVVLLSEGNDSNLKTSPDGVNWALRPVNGTPNNNWTSLVYGNNRFAAVANSGTNRVMTSSLSAAPGIPSITSLTGGDASGSLAFTAPVQVAGVALTDYEYSVDNGTTWIAAADTITPIQITGLTNGITYTVKLRAINNAGASCASVAATVTPSASVLSDITVSTTDNKVIFTINGNGSSVSDFHTSLSGNLLTITAANSQNRIALDGGISAGITTNGTSTVTVDLTTFSAFAGISFVGGSGTDNITIGSGGIDLSAISGGGADQSLLINIGSSNDLLTIANAITAKGAGNIWLKGGLGYSIAAPVTAAADSLTLISDGTVTQTAPVSATHLTLGEGTVFSGCYTTINNAGSYTLSNSLNDVVRLSTSTSGSITFNDNNEVSLAGSGAKHGGNLTVTAGGNLEVLSCGTYNPTSSGDVSLSTTTGTLNIHDGGINTGGNITVSSADNTITIWGGGLVSKANISVTAYGSIVSGGGGISNTSGTGNLSVTSSHGNVTINDSGISSYGNIGLSAYGDIMVNNGPVTNGSGSGDLTLTSINGTILTSSGGLVSHGKVSVRAQGNCSFSGAGINNLQGKGIDVISLNGAVEIHDGGAVSADTISVEASGNISLLGNGANNTSGFGPVILLSHNGTVSIDQGGLNAKDNAIIQSDKLSILTSLQSANKKVTMFPANSTVSIDLGGSDATNVLGITNSELSQITADSVAIGDLTKTANIVVSSKISDTLHKLIFATAPSGGITLNDSLKLKDVNISLVNKYSTTILSRTRAYVMRVSGSVTLGTNTVLDISTLATGFVIGDSIRIIDNGLSDAISGTFKGLAQGDTFTILDGSATKVGLRINYRGGDGNDVTVKVVPSCLTPTAPAAEGTPVCNGSAATLSASGTGTLGWYDAATGGNWIHGGSSYTTPALSVNTTYYVQDSLCSASLTRTAVLVTVNALPALFAVTGGGNYSAGGPIVAVGLDGSQSGVNYQLKIAGRDTLSTLSGTGAALSFGPQSSIGIYTVNASDAVTTCTQMMTGSALLSNGFSVTGGGSYCAGSTGVLIGLSGSATGVKYLLHSGNGTEYSHDKSVTGTGSAISFGLVTIAGIYTVYSKTGSPAVYTKMTGSATVIMNALPTAYSVTGGGTYCTGGSGVLVGLSGSKTGIIYQLKVGGADAGSPLNGTGSVLSFGVQTLAGTFTVLATDATSLCQKTMTSSVTVKVSSPPTVAEIAGGAVSVCVNSKTQAFTDATKGGTWSIAPASVSSFAVGGAATITSGGVVTGLTTGTVNVTYTVTSGCSTSVVKMLTINALPDAPAAITGTLNVCAGSTTALADVTADGAWSSSSSSVATVSGTGVVTGVSAGTTTIYYTVSNISGCTNRVSATVTINPKAAQPSGFDKSSATVTQAQSSVVYSVPNVPGMIYSWSYSGTGVTINGTTNDPTVALQAIAGVSIAKATNSVTISFSKSATSGVLSVTATNSCGTGAARTLYISVKKYGAKSVDLTTVAASLIQDIPVLTDEFTVYPNPASGPASFNFRIAESGRVRIELYSINGQHNARIFDGDVEAGIQQSVLFEQNLPTGIYPCILTYNGKAFSLKLAVRH